MRDYAQLTKEQRYHIYALKNTGHSQAAIAKAVGVYKSTISREFKRNQGERGYRPKQAHEKAITRRSGKVKLRIKESDWELVDRLVEKDWSPEQISRRLIHEQGIQISHEWIYQHIYKEKQSGGSLHLHLRCQKQKRKRYGSYDRRGQLPDRIFIDERPSVVDLRQRIGDWESDTIIGKRHKGSLISLVERKSLYTLLVGLLSVKTAERVKDRTADSMKLHKDRVHTITFDNGKEFAKHTRSWLKNSTPTFILPIPMPPGRED
jgi:IS30 family transposase